MKLLIAKFYDTVGLIQPVIIKTKLFFEDVCLRNVDWDCKITEQLQENWQFILKFVKNIASICINRCYFYDVEPHYYIMLYQLHGFSDDVKKLMGVVFIWNALPKITSFHLC